LASALRALVGTHYPSLAFAPTQEVAPPARHMLTVGFILICAVLFVILNSAPQKLLIFAGAFNRIILPIAFAMVMWVAFKRRDLMQGVKHPIWLLVAGSLALVLEIYIGVKSFSS